MHWYFFRINRQCHIKFVIQVNVYNMHGKQYLNNDLKHGNDPFMMNHHQQIQILNKTISIKSLVVCIEILYKTNLSKAMSHIYKEFLFFCFVLYCPNVLFVLLFILWILFVSLHWLLCFLSPLFCLFLVVIYVRWE